MTSPRTVTQLRASTREDLDALASLTERLCARISEEHVLSAHDARKHKAELTHAREEMISLKDENSRLQKALDVERDCTARMMADCKDAAAKAEAQTDDLRKGIQRAEETIAALRAQTVELRKREARLASENASIRAESAQVCEEKAKLLTENAALYEENLKLHQAQGS